MNSYLSWKSRDPEKRELRVKVSILERSLKLQKDNNRKLEDETRNWKKEVSNWKRKYEKLQKDQGNLIKKIGQVERQRDKYKALLFKKNANQVTLPPKLTPEEKRTLIEAATKRGAKKGHTPHFRKDINDINIDDTKRIFLTNCPNCNHRLKRGGSTEDHLIEDIPLDLIRAIATLWRVERQWCDNCKKEVKAKPKFVIPKARFGINTLVYILVLRYRVGLTIQRIRSILFDTFKIHVSKGGIINQLRQAKRYLEGDYNKILDKVRASPVKHADETSWRISGINSWVWAFLTKDNIYLTIEEGRGGAVPKEKLEGSTEEDVLVRDDYGGYKNLAMNHQSCWAHLLKEARFEVEAKGSSKEVKQLQEKLQGMFGVLKTETGLPFNKEKRDLLYLKMSFELKEIIEAKFIKTDSIRIQKRIKNQNTNLLTALLFPDVPLTNNLAERSLRPMVITRKLTGGSRSSDGATNHAINMSVIQTILAQNKELIPTLKEYLYLGATGKG